MERIADGKVTIYMAGPAGNFANNIYLVVDEATKQAAFIDAPAEPEKSIAVAEEAGVQPGAILLTHAHFDHTGGIEALKQRFGCKLYADPRESRLAEGLLDEPVSDGQEIRIGDIAFEVVSVPGHTEGSTTYLFGKHAFVGDTLFPGGPGRTGSPDDLRQELESITTRLYSLPEDTVIYPGHGATTTIGASKAEYEGFAAREHPSDLHGDVLWAES